MQCQVHRGIEEEVQVTSSPSTDALFLGPRTSVELLTSLALSAGPSRGDPHSPCSTGEALILS